MSVWSDGYVSDINYTYGYYAELDPQRAVLPLLMAGLAVPPVRTACELGFGQGLTINVHGAAGPAGWVLAWGAAGVLVSVAQAPSCFPEVDRLLMA